jgi:hypothetical protein
MLGQTFILITSLTIFLGIYILFKIQESNDIESANNTGYNIDGPPYTSKSGQHSTPHQNHTDSDHQPESLESKYLSDNSTSSDHSTLQPGSKSSINSHPTETANPANKSTSDAIHPIQTALENDPRNRNVKSRHDTE